MFSRTIIKLYKKQNNLRGFQSASELYQPERPQLVGAVSANFCGYTGAALSAQRVHTAIKLYQEYSF
jgi:hypothetical protein